MNPIECQRYRCDKKEIIPTHQNLIFKFNGKTYYSKKNPNKKEKNIWVCEECFETLLGFYNLRCKGDIGDISKYSVKFGTDSRERVITYNHAKWFKNTLFSQKKSKAKKHLEDFFS